MTSRMNYQRTRVELIKNMSDNEYPPTHTDEDCKWFKFKLNKLPISIATLNKYKDQNKTYRFREGSLYFTFISPGIFKQLGYCVDIDSEYHYFSAFLNVWDKEHYHITFAVANDALNILYAADYDKN